PRKSSPSWTRSSRRSRSTNGRKSLRQNRNSSGRRSTPSPTSYRTSNSTRRAASSTSPTATRRRRWSPRPPTSMARRRRRVGPHRSSVSTPRKCWAASAVLEPDRMPQLGQKLVIVVAAHEVVRDGYPHRRRGRLCGARARQHPFQSLPHQRKDARQPGDDPLGFHVDHAESWIRLLVVDDESQSGVQPFVPRQSGGRLRDAPFEGLSFPRGKRCDQFLFGGEPAVQRRPRHTGLQRHLRETELRHAPAAEHLSSGGEDPRTRGAVGVDQLVHHHSFTNFRQTVTLMIVTVATSPRAREYSPVDITSHDFWSQPFGVRDQTFAQLRAGHGLSWHPPMPSL